MSDSFATKLKRIRQENDWSKSELARRTGVSQSFISDLERGKKNPSMKIVQKISDHLNIPLQYLIEDEQDHSNDVLTPEMLLLWEAAEGLTPEMMVQAIEAIKALRELPPLPQPEEVERFEAENSRSLHNAFIERH